MRAQPDVAVIVPAVLGVGLLFSLGALTRDIIHRFYGRRALDRRAIHDGHAVALVARQGDDAARTDHTGFRPRWVYGVVGLAGMAMSIYLLLGSWGNFHGLTQWAKDVAWVFALFVTASGFFAAIGVTSLSVFVRFRRPPAWTKPLVAHTPLSRYPGPRHQAPAVKDLITERMRPLGSHHITDRIAFTARLVAVIWGFVAMSVFVALALRGRLPQAEGGTTLDAAIAGPIQVGLLVVVGLGMVLTLWREVLGATVMALSAAGLAIMASIQYPPRVAVGVGVVFFVPAFLHWLAWQRDRHMHHLVALFGVTLLLVGVVWVGADRVYSSYFGPAHPASTQPSLPDSLVEWAWAGGTTSTETTVVAKLRDDHQQVRVLVSDRPDLASPQASEPAVADNEGHRVVRATFDELRPDTEYFYALEADGEIDSIRTGSVRTFPEGPSSFTIAFGACARTGSNGAVFDAIRGEQPLAYLVLGDMHYANIASNNESLFRDALDRTLSATSQSALYRSTSASYVWDDHDYAANDANETAPTRPAAEAVYRQYVPHHALAGDATSGPIHQAFTIGRVRFILTDTRSTRTPQTATDDDEKFMMGPDQERWFVDELRAARDRDGVVVWVNPVPWIAAPSVGGDSWSGYTTQRARLADEVAALGMTDRLVMLSGDAHMVALDDGTNSDYSSAEAGGFPVLHGAALDRPGGVKGGPYSDGEFPGPGQFGLVRFTDSGADTVTVTLVGRTWDGRTLVERSFTLRAS
jgi:hypothetical protein